jgi:hypothetical protein
MVKLTAKVKLQAGEVQARALLETLERSNEACNWISEQACIAK